MDYIIKNREDFLIKFNKQNVKLQSSYILQFPYIFKDKFTTPLITKNNINIPLSKGAITYKKRNRYKNYDNNIYEEFSSPFTASKTINNSNRRIWVYIDEEDFLQGPFTTLEMDNWFNLKLLPLDLMIGHLNRKKCITLLDFINATYPNNIEEEEEN